MLTTSPTVLVVGSVTEEMMMKTVLGPVCDPSKAFDSITTALHNIPPHGTGLVWCLHGGNHWTIAGNYKDGAVWNGQSQIVPATATSLASLARSR